MPIKRGLLPERVSIARVPDQAVTATGDIATGPQLTSTSEPIRITSNKGDAVLGVGGVIGTSSHLAFMLPTANVLVDDILTTQVKGETFIVRFVDDRPGGVKGHHKQVYMDAYGIGGYS